MIKEEIKLLNFIILIILFHEKHNSILDFILYIDKNVAWYSWLMMKTDKKFLLNPFRGKLFISIIYLRSLHTISKLWFKYLWSYYPSIRFLNEIILR